MPVVQQCLKQYVCSTYIEQQPLKTKIRLIRCCSALLRNKFMLSDFSAYFHALTKSTAGCLSVFILDQIKYVINIQNERRKRANPQSACEVNAVCILLQKVHKKRALIGSFLHHMQSPGRYKLERW